MVETGEMGTVNNKSVKISIDRLEPISIFQFVFEGYVANPCRHTPNIAIDGPRHEYRWV